MTRPTFNRASMKLVDAIIEVFAVHGAPLTVRQVHYQLASSGLVPLSGPGYRKSQRMLLRVREEGIIPWESFADRTRERIKPSSWEDAAHFADTIGRAYRKDLWREQPDHVEFWLEKDALSAFVGDVLNEYGVPLYVARGFSSATFLHEAAEALNRIDKPKYIYYLGDHDPAGMSIEKSVSGRLREFGSNFEIRRLAVDLTDIKTFGLRPLEAKKSDSRYAAYVAEHGTASIELDAMPPDELRKRIRNAIDLHRDVDAWDRLRRVERIEKETIRGLAERMAVAS